MLEFSYVRDILNRMQTEDPEYRVFGSNMHKYRLGAPVPESELTAFEEKYQVRLPEDYRDFMKYVGNGTGPVNDATVGRMNAGAGPYYGLLPFAEAHFDCQPQLRFPLTLAQGAEKKGVNIFPADVLDGDPEFPGMIKICHQGCAGYFYLVVNGESYGRIWETWEYDLYATGWTFEQWYGNWLNHLVETAIPMLHRERVVAQIEVGMTRGEVERICGKEGTVRDFGNGKRFAFLSFPDLVSQFKLDENDRVERIVKHSISLPRLPVSLPL